MKTAASAARPKPKMVRAEFRLRNWRVGIEPQAPITLVDDAPEEFDRGERRADASLRETNHVRSERASSVQSERIATSEKKNHAIAIGLHVNGVPVIVVPHRERISQLVPHERIQVHVPSARSVSPAGVPVMTNCALSSVGAPHAMQFTPAPSRSLPW